jgi:hypothetical protein
MPKFLTIEEMKDLDKLTMDELHGILTAYEMRIEKEKPSKKEAISKPQRRQRTKNTNQVNCSNL